MTDPATARAEIAALVEKFRAIDALAYELYDLTPTEIALVEAAIT
ncbi:MAG: hypothetical protein U0452_07770 [Anaerolineae bacterium]